MYQIATSKRQHSWPQAFAHTVQIRNIQMLIYVLLLVKAVYKN